jgi:G3E family GTPase
MDVTFFTGFLGSGKTTTLKRLLREHGEGRSFGVIVNDLSELEVDGELIGMEERVSVKNGTLAVLNNGSISGEKLGSFAGEVARMKQGGIRHLLVEASGASHPAAVIDAIQSVAGTTLRAVIAMVDARALLHDHGGGLDLVERLTSHTEDDPCAADLLASQLQSASVIALTKADLVPEAELERLLRSLHAINPTATLTACVYGKLDARLILESTPYRGGFVEQRPEQGGAQRYDIGTTVVRNSRPLHPQRFHTLYRDRLGLGIFRSKGFIWLASRPADVLLWNQAGGAMGLEWLATWRVAILEGQGGHPLLPEEKDQLKKALLGTHPLFGDRGNELTVIGHAMDRAVFCRELEECFCTDEEVEQWRQGGSFPDPWPTRIRET